MPTPLPEPTGRSSSRHKSSPTPARKTVVESTNKPTLEQLTDRLAKVISDTSLPIASAINEESDDAPTVISASRQKTSNFDSKLGDKLNGRRLGHFELLESIGVGGMAAVLRARDLDLGREVALKILPPDMAADPENITRFKQEGRAAARLDHENIARVYFCGEDQGLHFIAFEFVEGENLRVRMDRHGGRLPVTEGVSYMIQVAMGLSHAASRSVVHRDIKPSNIIVTPQGKAKIVDMGLARNLDPRATDGGVTQSGVTLGTFDYISPEQALEPRSADTRSDIYSMGCAFYHVFTGHAPFPEGTAAKKLHCHENERAVDPRELNPDIPDELAAVLGKMMAKKPADRYQHPDHLVQHLLQLSEKWNLGHGTPNLVGDRAIPIPPRLSPWLITTALVALGIAIFAITGGFGRKDPLEANPLWLTEKEPSKSVPEPVTAVLPGPITPAIPNVKEPRKAADAGELIALLKQGLSHIRLSGTEYDLTNSDAIFVGRELLLEPDVGSDPQRPPVIRLGQGPVDDGKVARPGSLTFRGSDEAKTNNTIRIRGIRFEIQPEVGAGGNGLSFWGLERLDLEQCSFVSLNPQAEGIAAINSAARLSNKTPTINLKQCYFASGSVGLSIDSVTRLDATECAFAPATSQIQVRRGDRDPTDDKTWATIRLRRCSSILTHGSVVEIGDGVPCRVLAGHCVFSGLHADDQDPARAILIRQMGTRSDETRYRRLRAEDVGDGSNIYHNIAAFMEGNQAYSFAECEKNRLPIEDTEKATKHPWKAERPLLLLAANPRQAFALNVLLPELRLPEDPTRELLGAKTLAGTPLYDVVTLPPLRTEPRPPANHKIWDPSLPRSAEDLPPGVYPTIEKALAAIQPGDTLLIRHNGLLKLDPVEFKKAETRLTIKADEGYKPLLVPAEATLKREPALFKLYGGQLILDGLQFRLQAGRTPALVTLPGGGLFEWRNGAITLEDGDDLTVALLADPRGEMMMGPAPDRWPTPKLIFDHVFVRGRGKFLTVKGSRPFELDIKNSLTVLDGHLIDIDPSSADVASANPIQVRLNQVTTYLTGHLVRMRATEKKAETTSLGLVRTEVQSTNCLFVPCTRGDSAEPLVRLDRIETEEQARRCFQWKAARGNHYAYDKKQVMLAIVPENTEAMPLKPIEGDRWLEVSLEEGDPFGNVKFAYLPPAANRPKAFTVVMPSDFRVKSYDTPRPETSPEAGFVGNLPKPYLED